MQGVRDSHPDWNLRPPGRFLPVTLSAPRSARKLQTGFTSWNMAPWRALPPIPFNSIPIPSRPSTATSRVSFSDLKHLEAKKYKIYLFAENPKQLERLHGIFADLKSEINFTPVPTSIHEGFIDDDLKVVCYTDHQIFQRYHKYKVKQAYNKNQGTHFKNPARTTTRRLCNAYRSWSWRVTAVYRRLKRMAGYRKRLEFIYKDSDILYVNINSLHKISKYTRQRRNGAKNE